MIIARTATVNTISPQLNPKLSLKEYPAASIITEPSSTFSASEWMKFLETNFDGSSDRLHTEMFEKLPDSFSLKNLSCNSVEKLILFLEYLIRGQYGKIIRAKGQIPIGRQILEFDMADQSYRLRGTEIQSSGKIVFFGNNIHRQEILRHFHVENDSVKFQIPKYLPGKRKEKPGYSIQKTEQGIILHIPCSVKILLSS